MGHLRHANFGLDTEICSLVDKISTSKIRLMFSYVIPCNETNSLIGAWVFLRELNESHLSLASDWYAYYNIGCNKTNPVTHLKSTNEVRITKCVSIISLSTNMADSLNKPHARTMSFFSMQPMKN